MTSCQKKQDVISAEELAREDSLALHVAVMPVIDCLPIYYAKHTGMFEAEGLDVRLLEHLSQMDCDTSLLNRRAEMAYTDIFRVLLMKENIGVATITSGKLSLITARTKRVRQLKHLNERMVALERFSTSDFWSDRLTDDAGMEKNDIYRPQINDVRLRTSMLNEQLVDAALLPEPYATQAELQGNKRIKSVLEADSLPHFNCLALHRKLLADKYRKGQLKDFFTVYEKAVKTINNKEYDREVLNSILYYQYEMPVTVIDTLKIPQMYGVQKPKESDVDKAITWLQSRERAPQKQRRDSLVYKVP